MAEPLHVCVCNSVWLDRLDPDARAATLAPFAGLDREVRFDFAPYHDGGQVRIMRADPARAAEARTLVTAPSAALRESLARAEVILAGDLPYDMDVLAPGLRWVQGTGAGVAQMFGCGLDRGDVVLTTGAGVTNNSIAEFVLARILAHWKHFDTFADQQRARRWRARHGRVLAGDTIALVGFGAIGASIAWRAKAWGMRVVATRRHLPAEGDPTVDAFYPADALARMLSEADAVVVCAPENRDTYHLFDAAAFAAMKPGAFFCNVSRGSLVDEAALCAALHDDHLGAAAIDVTAHEPLPPDDPLWDAPRLAISPHSAASLDDYTDRVWALFADNMARYVAGRPLLNVTTPADAP